MANYFFADANGQKQGPVTEQELQELADQGIINPNTRLVTDTGHQGRAGQIPGLRFNTAAPSPKQLYCTNCGNSISEQAIACISCGSKPVGHRKFCRQCAATLKPEQVVCTKCGTKVKGASSQTSLGASAVNQFCTNCGNPATAQAVACMSCGAKPTGHKKFCRQCGVGLSSEQVVCVKCGTSVSATRIPDAKQMVQSVISSPNIGKFKTFALWGIGIVVVVFLLLFLAKTVPSLFVSHPLKNAKPGDWVRYDITGTVDGSRMPVATFGVEVLSNDGKKVKLRITGDASARFGPPNPWSRNSRDETQFFHLVQAVGQRRIQNEIPRPGGMWQEEQVIEVDLSKPPQRAVSLLIKFLDAAGMDIKVKTGKQVKESVLAAGKGLDCVVTPVTVTVIGLNGESFTAIVKAWTFKDVPVGGVAKFEWDATTATKQDTTKFTMTMTLAGSGKSGG